MPFWAGRREKLIKVVRKCLSSLFKHLYIDPGWQRPGWLARTTNKNRTEASAAKCKWLRCDEHPARERRSHSRNEHKFKFQRRCARTFAWAVVPGNRPTKTSPSRAHGPNQECKLCHNKSEHPQGISCGHGHGYGFLNCWETNPSVAQAPAVYEYVRGPTPRTPKTSRKYVKNSQTYPKKNPKSLYAFCWVK